MVFEQLLNVEDGFPRISGTGVVQAIHLDTLVDSDLFDFEL